MNIKTIFNNSNKLYLFLLFTILLFLGLLVYNNQNFREGLYNNNPEPEFIESKRFIGSKKGYVFKMDKKGLGYYVDIKPKITI